MPILSSGQYRPAAHQQSAHERPDLGFTLFTKVFGQSDLQDYHAWLHDHGEYALLAEVTTHRFWLGVQQGMTLVRHKRMSGEFFYDGKTKRVLSVDGHASLDAGVFALAIKAGGLQYALRLLHGCD